MTYLQISVLNAYLCFQGGWEDHLDGFLQVVGGFNVDHEDAVMGIFVLTLEWEAQAWYKSLLGASIDG